MLTNEITTVNLALLTLAIELLKKNQLTGGDNETNRFSLTKRQADDLSCFSDERARQVSRCGRSLFVPIHLGDGAARKNNPPYPEYVDGLISACYYDLLVLIRESSRTRPFEAFWRFNLSTDDLHRMEGATLADLKRQSHLSALKLCILPKHASGTVSPRFHAALFDCQVSPIN
jgi:hypothetical protein